MIRIENKIIKNINGDIIKIIDKKNFNNPFEEFYITSINSGAIKAWKIHKKTNLYIIILEGKIKLVTKFKNNRFKSAILKKNYLNLIKIEKNTLFGFKGLSSYKSNILVISEVYHSTEEVITFPLDHYNYKW